MTMEPIDDHNLDIFETQRHIMAGTWDIWRDEEKWGQVKILMREAHKVKYDEESNTESDR